MVILGIETSCDETAAGVVESGFIVKSNVVFTQEDLHSPHGGVVPELASRRHISVIDSVVLRALDEASVNPSDLAAIAVTQGPGLMGALLVGVSFAKGMAYQYQRPLIGINHLEGHISAISLEAGFSGRIRFPLVVLVVSGGHTNLYLMTAFGEYEQLGKTVDDAAGEAFDKGAKMLGLGFPGGPLIDTLSKNGDPKAVQFPRPEPGKGKLDFSFSGLKTSLKYYLEKKNGLTETDLPDIAAGYQMAIVDVLVDKCLIAVERYHAKGLVVSGGVAANSMLRSTLENRLSRTEHLLFIPRPSLCTDNGAMIAAAAFHQFPKKTRHRTSYLSLSATANLPIHQGPKRNWSS